MMTNLYQILFSVFTLFVFWNKHTQEVIATPMKNPIIANTKAWFILTFGNFFI